MMGMHSVNNTDDMNCIFLFGNDCGKERPYNFCIFQKTDRNMCLYNLYNKPYMIKLKVKLPIKSTNGGKPYSMR